MEWLLARLLAVTSELPVSVRHGTVGWESLKAPTKEIIRQLASITEPVSLKGVFPDGSS